MEPQSDPGLLVQELIYAGLDALRQVEELDLCAYLHTTDNEGPQLFLGAPDLASIDPSEAFNLFAALRDTLEHDHDGDETLLLGHFWAVAVTTEGPRSKGLHVVGRHEHALENGARAGLVRLARALGTVVHRTEGQPANKRGVAPAPASSPVRVAVESGDGGTHAEVSVAVGSEIRTGTAKEPTPIRSVAAAVIDAVDTSVKLVEAVDGDVAGERAVLVLMTRDGRNGLGSALVGEEADPLRAAAVAGLEAVTRLQGLPPAPQRNPRAADAGVPDQPFR